MPRLSIVIPMLNEAANVVGLCARLFPALAATGERFEVIAVDDGSTDGTLALLQEQRRAHPELRLVSLARRFGQHAAVLAGFEAARGEWLITLDADLQNPPEEIPRLVEALRAGHDLVHTWREGREDPRFRKLASGLVNRAMRRTSGLALRDFGCMLRGYHRSVVEPMLRRGEACRFIPALATLHARRPIEIPVRHAARARGASNYSLSRLLALQLDLVTSLSSGPRRLLLLLGGVALGLVLVAGAGLPFVQWLRNPLPSGPLGSAALLVLLAGALCLGLLLLGVCLGRLVQELRRAPPYIVRPLPELPPRVRP